MRRKLFHLFIFMSVSLSSLFASTHNLNIISSSAQQITFQVQPEWRQVSIKSDAAIYEKMTFDGADVVAESGQPQIPSMTITVGVPLNGDVSVTLLDSEMETINGVQLSPQPRMKRQDIGVDYIYTKDETAYSSSSYLPQELLSASEPHYFQSQRVAKITVRPLQYNPTSNVVRRFKKMTVQVSFSGSSTASVFAPATNESVYRQLVLNYNQAKNWRKPYERSLSKPQQNSFQGDNWYKIKITGDGTGGKEGMYKISGATLKQALSQNNVSLSSIDPSTIQLFNNGGRELSHDVVVAKNDTLIENPVLVVGGQDGAFNDGDFVLFYGHSAEGVEFNPSRNKLLHYIHPYTFDNVYWLTFNKTLGKRIETAPSVDVNGLVEETSFRDLAWLEEERYNIYNSGITWLGHEMKTGDATYSVNFNLADAVPEENAVFRFSLASLTSGRHQFSMYANGNSLGQFNQNGGTSSYYIKESEFLEPGVLLGGDNTITVNYNVSSQTSFSYVDYIEVEYRRRFRAQQDQLLFFAPVRTDAARYRISGFSQSDLYVFDVTDFSSIHAVDPALTSNGVLEFGDHCDPLNAKRYLAVSPAAFKSVEVEQISAKKIIGIRRSMSNVDYIIITHDDFYQQAMQLESLRENWSPKDRLETEIVNYSDVINEFGWGIADPAAIRNFLAYARDHWGDPKYVLLIGDGHYDYKNILKHNIPNLIVPYETAGSNENLTRTTDDWYTYSKGNNAGMQMAIGRLIIQSVDEVQQLIDKIVDYETNPEYGEWLKTVTIVADDEYTNTSSSEILHTDQAERLAEVYVPDLLNVKKIYLINYPEVKTASITGREKPAAALDLMQQINQGSLIINYIGHGNDELWAHEKVLDNVRDFDNFDNGKRMAMWIAATCEFAHWDQPTEQSFAERILSAPNRGAVTMVSSARLAYSGDNARFNYALYTNLFAEYAQTGLTARVGDAVMLAKRGGGDTANNEKYALFGDPAMRLCAPRFRAVIDAVNPDSIQALSTMSISGHVEDAGKPLQDYDGKILLRVLDTRKSYVYTSPSGYKSNTLQTMGNNIFRGIAAVENGEFNVKLIVPKDISYGGNDARISLYFWNENTSGTGAAKGIAVGSSGANLVDSEGPNMHLYFGNPDFVPGDYVSTRPSLTLNVSDSVSGVNTAGDIGHQILLTLDEDYTNSKDITEYFTYKEGSYTDGALTYTILDLPIGEHTVQVKAWDNSNNSSIIETHFVVIDDTNLEVRNALTYPNPMVDDCSFRYELSQDAEVSLRVYTVAGRLVKKFDAAQGRVGYNVFPEYWDGRDSSGDKIANGVYLYKISAKSIGDEESATAESIGKLIVAQ
jgi:hypothetical protein